MYFLEPSDIKPDYLLDWPAVALTHSVGIPICLQANIAAAFNVWSYGQAAAATGLAAVSIYAAYAERKAIRRCACGVAFPQLRLAAGDMQWDVVAIPPNQACCLTDKSAPRPTNVSRVAGRAASQISGGVLDLLVAGFSFNPNPAARRRW